MSEITEIGGQPAKGVNYGAGEGWSAGFIGTPITDAIARTATRAAAFHGVSVVRVTVYVLAHVHATFALDEITWRTPLDHGELLKGPDTVSLDRAHVIVRDLLHEDLAAHAAGIAYRLLLQSAR